MPQAASSAPPRAGAVARHTPAPPDIDGWRLGELLHRGRWCSLWQAHPAENRPALASEYVLKVTHDDAAQGDWGRQMLRREAAVSRAVAQRHLITVLSSHTGHSPAFIALPHLAGATLADALATKTILSAAHALWIARQVAEALAALHAAHWLHGDVKPENVMIQPDGHATLIDLGFAQQMDEAASVAARMYCGTLRYTAPERFVSTTAIGGASDCYSLGVMLFEMLAGRAPFETRDPHALAVAHVEQTPPDVRRFAPQTPREIARLLHALLAKNPLRRPTAEQLVPQLCRLEIASLDAGGVCACLPSPAAGRGLGGEGLPR